jgi:hypothetical protein
MKENQKVTTGDYCSFTLTTAKVALRSRLAIKAKLSSSNRMEINLTAGTKNEFTNLLERLVSNSYILKTFSF